MIAAAPILNILVLIPVTTGLWRNTDGMVQAFGPETPARSILLSVYLAIVVLSALELAGLAAGVPAAPNAALTLLVFQIVYKTLTIILVGLTNLVVKTNAAIAAFHSLVVAAQLI